LPWEKAKAWDNSAVVGKWILMPNVKNKKDINFCLYKNKELVQQGNSNLMIHSFDEIVAYISNFFSINIGDLIFTGTPAGVGEAVVGDELEIFIEDESLLTLEVKLKPKPTAIVVWKLYKQRIEPSRRDGFLFTLTCG